MNQSNEREAAIKRREEKIFAFLEIRQNFEAYLQEFIFGKNEFLYRYNVHLKNNPVLQFFCKFLSDLELPRTKSVTNVTFPGHMEIFYNLALTCWDLSHLMNPYFVSNNRQFKALLY